MKRLILMRHAKSGWSDLSAKDHERTLNQRGIDSATAMGVWLRKNALFARPYPVFGCRKDTETLALLGLPETSTTTTRSLYLAEAGFMARMLMQQADDCILMVAHNPGTALLALWLLAAEPDHQEFDAFPTCATLVVDFEIDTWRDLATAAGRIVHFTVPRDLIG